MNYADKAYLDTKGAADFLSTAECAIRCRVNRGQLRPLKPFGRRGRSFFRRSDLVRLMEGPIQAGFYGSKILSGQKRK
jgi:hypothetical protein